MLGKDDKFPEYLLPQGGKAVIEPEFNHKGELKKLTLVFEEPSHQRVSIVMDIHSMTNKSFVEISLKEGESLVVRCESGNFESRHPAFSFPNLSHVEIDKENVRTVLNGLPYRVIAWFTDD